MQTEETAVTRLVRLLIRVYAEWQRRHTASFDKPQGWAIALALLIVAAVGFTIVQIAPAPKASPAPATPVLAGLGAWVFG